MMLRRNKHNFNGANRFLVFYAYDADFCGLPASPNSGSSRNSLFSILSSSSQATSRSNQSQSRRTFTERLQLGIGQQPQDHFQRHAWPRHEVIELANQGSPI